MLVRDLPDDAKQELRKMYAQDTAFLERLWQLTLEEASLWIKTRLEDSKQTIERKQRRLAMEGEINDLARSVSEQYPDLPLYKVEYFLHGEARKRFQTLMRELNKMSRVPLVRYGRQPWHTAVEEEIQRRHDTTIDSVVEATLARDPAYPAGRVRAYATYILETALGER
jgi:hypothetical protein